MTPHLWSTDFDGTLYSGQRKGARITAPVISTIANWLMQGGTFHVLSGGSMQGLARDGFDFFPEVVSTLRKCGMRDAVETVCERVLFSMSNGAENYHIVDPLAPIKNGQLRYAAELSRSATQAQAAEFSRAMQARFGLETLASDSPVGDPEDRCCAIFLRQKSDAAVSRAVDLLNEYNEFLVREQSPFRMVFVRENNQDAHVVRRFDAFPVDASGSVSKALIAKAHYPKFTSVVYTGDQPDGNDADVFALTDSFPHLTAHAVKDVGSLVRLIEHSSRDSTGAVHER